MGSGSLLEEWLVSCPQQFFRACWDACVYGGPPAGEVPGPEASVLRSQRLGTCSCTHLRVVLCDETGCDVLF